MVVNPGLCGRKPRFIYLVVVNLGLYGLCGRKPRFLWS